MSFKTQRLAIHSTQNKISPVLQLLKLTFILGNLSFLSINFGFADFESYSERPDIRQIPLVTYPAASRLDEKTGEA